MLTVGAPLSWEVGEDLPKVREFCGNFRSGLIEGWVQNYMRMLYTAKVPGRVFPGVPG
jgi:hypothetical protein